MSKMDRMLNSKREKNSIYEIYRACRLCGAGAGYKMPIIQNVIDLDDTDVELKQKIRECVQLEVHQDDKMPPLICELCVDKVNDFYEFLEMCRQTNKRTRLRLGLPPQSLPMGAPDAGDCILGLAEPVYANEDSDGEPLAKQRKMPKPKSKKEPEVKVKLEIMPPSEERSSRHRSTRRARTPPRITRHSKHSKGDTSLTRTQEKSQKSTPKSILKKEKKTEDTSLLTPRLKRSRDKEPVKLEPNVKKVKITIKPVSLPSSSKSSPKSSPRLSKVKSSPKPSPKRPPSPPRVYKCSLCKVAGKTPQALGNHMRTHSVTFTNPKLACNPCGDWFASAEETASHHKRHRSKAKPYHCRTCTADFKHLTAYDDHFGKKQCLPETEVPDVKCESCWHLFPTNKLLADHKCLGEDHRPGGKCGKCSRSYALLKNLKKHESLCTAKKKGEVVVDPVLLGKIKPIQVRVSRCDPLLTNIKQEHYDVSSVTSNFGLDKNCVYPYITSVSSLRIKSEPDELNGMVAINQDIKDEFFTEEDYVHWDSDESESDEEVSCSLVDSPVAKIKRIDSLATLTLKTIFSQRCLGKVPRKRRRVKQEKSMFDSLLADTQDDVTKDINNIIDNLGNDDDDDLNDKSVDSRNDTSVDDISKSVDDSQNDVSAVDVSKNDDDSHKDVSDVELSENDKEKNEQNDAQNDVSLVKENDCANDSAEKSNSNDVTDSADKNNDASDDVHENDEKVSTNDEKASANDEKASTNDEKALTNDVKDTNGTVDDKTDGDLMCNDDTGSNNDLSNNVSTQIDNKVQVNNGTINNTNIDNDSIVSKGGNDSNSSNVAEVRLSNDENHNDADDARGGDVTEKNEEKMPENEERSGKNYTCDSSQDSSSIGTFSESLLNDNTQSNDEVNDMNGDKKSINDLNFNVKCINDNATSAPDQNDDDDNKTELSLDNLSQDSKISDSELNLSLLDSKDSCSTQNDERKFCQDSQDDSSVNDGKASVINKVDSEDMDDKNLMAALDAQIGEQNESTPRGGQENDGFADKIAIEDLISDKNSAKAMELDMIPDEFSFDA